MVIKIQSSLSSSDGIKRCLVYNETKDVYYETEKPEEVEVLTELLNGEPKGYFEAEITGTEMVVVERLEDQPW